MAIRHVFIERSTWARRRHRSGALFRFAPLVGLVVTILVFVAGIWGWHRYHDYLQWRANRNLGLTLALEKGEFLKAEPILREVIARWGEDEQVEKALRVIGEYKVSIKQRALALALKDGDFARAEPLLLQAKRWFPDDVAIARALALAQRPLGKLASEAEEHLSHWCSVDKNNPDAFKERMRLWLRLGLSDRALKDGLRVLQLAPNDTAVREEVAIQAMLLGKHKLAEQHLFECLKRKPGDVYLLCLLTRNYQRQGLLGCAENVLKHLEKCEKAEPLAAMVRGIQYCLLQRFTEAIPYLRQAEKGELHEQQRREVLYYLSRALFQVGKRDEAEKVRHRWEQFQLARTLEQKAQLSPHDTDLAIRAAKLLIELQENARAEAILLAVLRQHPNHQEATGLLRMLRREKS